MSKKLTTIKASQFYKIVTKPEIEKAMKYIDENPNSIPKKIKQQNTLY